MASKQQYVIKPLSMEKIQQLNQKLDTDVFSIRRSTDPSKKIDVFLRDKKIATIGDSALPDYPTYIKTDGLEFANKRKDAFYSRFKKLPDIKDGKIQTIFWSRYLLW